MSQNSNLNSLTRVGVICVRRHVFISVGSPRYTKRRDALPVQRNRSRKLVVFLRQIQRIFPLFKYAFSIVWSVFLMRGFPRISFITNRFTKRKLYGQ